jgi:hypothetical protein
MDVVAVDEDAIQQEARPRKRASFRDEEEPVRPRSRPRADRINVRKRTGSNKGLLIGLLVGAVALVLLVGGGIGALLWFNSSRPSLTPAEALTALTGDMGPWPEAGGLFGPRGAWPAEQVVTLHISGVADRNTQQAIEDKLGSLVDPGRGSSTSSSYVGDRMSVQLAPVQDPQAFAQRVNFGTVVSVKGRVVTIVAKKVDGPPPNADPVTQALFELKSPNAHRRGQAAGKLAGMLPDNRRAEVTAALEPLLNDPDFFVRDNVNKAIGTWGTKENVPALIRALNHEQTRGSAIQALGKLKDERAIEPLTQMLENFFASHDASEALIAMGPVAEPAVIKLLRHPKNDVRGAAIEILKKIGTKASIPHLRIVVAEKDFFLKGPAEDAIRSIEASGR